jgi:PKD repeat protein
MATRLSTLDSGYAIGNLSVYPIALDNKEVLYEVRNNAETVLRQSVSFNGKYIIVENNDKFPDKGVIRIGPPPGKSGNHELIYYAVKSKGVFSDLARGFAGSKQTTWSINSHVCNVVAAEHHNALRDAVYNIENNLGTSSSPLPTSLNGILKKQENIFFSPKAIFRAHRISGAPPLKVRFQNFSAGNLIRHFWDFGDGTTSVEKSPTHTYQNEGAYTVQLNIVSSLGGQGVMTKDNYITVSNQEISSFFYIRPIQGVSSETAALESTTPTEFVFTDQTDGDIVQRYWIFDGEGTIDGIPVQNQSYQENNPNNHSVKFVYDKKGNYRPSLIVVLDNSLSKRTYLTENIVVD